MSLRRNKKQSNSRRLGTKVDMERERKSLEGQPLEDKTTRKQNIGNQSSEYEIFTSNNNWFMLTLLITVNFFGKQLKAKNKTPNPYTAHKIYLEPTSEDCTLGLLVKQFHKDSLETSSNSTIPEFDKITKALEAD